MSNFFDILFGFNSKMALGGTIPGRKYLFDKTIFTGEGLLEKAKEIGKSEGKQITTVEEAIDFLGKKRVQVIEKGHGIIRIGEFEVYYSEYKKGWIVATKKGIARMYSQNPEEVIEYALKESEKPAGTIENQYAGKKPDYIWQAWNEGQRTHFLEDHKVEIPKLNTHSHELLKLVKTGYEALPSEVKDAIKIHVSEGQYKFGGKLKDLSQKIFTGMSDKELAEMKKESGSYKKGGKIWFQEAIAKGHNLGGWRKELPAAKRRKEALESRSKKLTLKKKYLSTARALMALHNVTRDKETKKISKEDANHFFMMAKKHK